MNTARRPRKRMRLFRLDVGWSRLLVVRPLVVSSLVVPTLVLPSLVVSALVVSSLRGQVRGGRLLNRHVDGGGLHGDVSRFRGDGLHVDGVLGDAGILDDGVETVDGVGSVADGAHPAVGLDDAVVAGDGVSVTCLFLGLGVAGESVVDGIRVRVLGVGVEIKIGPSGVPCGTLVAGEESCACA